MNLALLRFSLILAAAGQLAAQGTITTFAGTEWVFNGDGKPALSAPLGGVASATTDPNGNVVIADPDNCVVVRLNRSGLLTVIAGNGLQGYSGDGGPAVNASLFSPQGIAYDSKGNLFIADQTNSRIRRVDTNGVITTVAGTGIPGVSGNGGPAKSALIYQPTALAIDASDNVYFSDNGNTLIRKIDTNGVVSLFAGNNQATLYGENVAATVASLGNIEDIAAAKGVLYLADFAYHVIRRIDLKTGIITTVAGTPLQAGFSGDGNLATKAQLNSPGGVAADASGNIYISDTNNFEVRRVDATGIITTIAGSLGKAGFVDGAASTAVFRSVFGLVADASGNVYVTDSYNHRVRRITGSQVSSVAGNGFSSPGTFRFIPDQTPANNAYFFDPFGISFDPNGNLLVADGSNNRIRKISPSGAVTTIAGDGGIEFSGDGGQAVAAGVAGPNAVVGSKSGNIYIADSDNNRIRKIASNGVITTVAGTGTPGFSGDGASATQATLNHPTAVIVDANENLYIADTNNNVVRKVSGGTITTIAGNPKATFLGDNGLATAAGMSWPVALALDANANNLYISDNQDGRVRKLSLSSGVISTLALIARPTGLALDGAGNLYVSDAANNQVDRIALSNGAMSVVAGSGARGFNGDGGLSTQASLNFPDGLAIDASGSLFIADAVNNRIRQILTAPVTLQISTSSLSFSAKSAGAITDAKSVGIATQIGTAAGPALPYTLTVSTTDGGAWLTASVGTNSTTQGVAALSGTTPSSVQVLVDPSALTAGATYKGSLVINAPGATPPTATIQVSVTLDPPVAPSLSVSGPGLDPTTVQGSIVSGALTSSLVQGSSAVSQTLSVVNSGGGTLNFTPTAITASGVNWLTVSTPNGTAATPAQPGQVTVQSDPTGLAPGTYTGTVTIASDTAGSLQANVILSVASVPHKLLLSQTGLTFTAVSGGGAPLDQTFAVVNAGQGTLNWTVQAKTLGGNSSWLLVTPAAGSGGASVANSSTVPLVDVAVNASNLNPGEYYGQIQIVSPDADNSPQTVTVVLDVKQPGFDPGPQVQPTGLVFTGAAGSVPGSQTVYVSNLTAGNISYSSSVSTEDGSPWFVAAPTNSTIAPTQLGQPAKIVVQPDFTKLTSGIYNGTLSLNFGSVTRTITVTAIAGNSGGGNTADSAGSAPLRSHATAAAPCSGGLKVTMLSPQPGFSVVASKPTTVQATVLDSCNNPITPSSGHAVSVKVRILIGGVFQPEVPLVFSGSATWQQSWQPATSNAATVQMYVLASVDLPGGTANATGQNTAISGALTLPPSDVPPTPLLKQAIQNSASLVNEPLVAPGGLITMFGQNLVDMTDPGACQGTLPAPLPTTLAGAQIFVGNTPLAISYACGTQINAQLPYDMSSLDTQGVGLWMQRSDAQTNAQSVQVSISTASTQPAVFSLDFSGQGQGRIDDVNADGSVTQNGTAAPAHAGSTVILYCAGLGAVSPSVSLGAAAPSAPPAVPQNAVQVTIGGVPAQLAAPPQLYPTLAGVYEVAVILPQNVPTGDQVPVVVTVLGQASPTVTMSVH